MKLSRELRLREVTEVKVEVVEKRNLFQSFRSRRVGFLKDGGMRRRENRCQAGLEGQRRSLVLKLDSRDG
jgi:hypothetical protein